jgi:hypothetical protein
VAHAYNPSFSGSRDQEDHGSKPAWANSSQDPILKIPNTKRTGGVAQGVGPEFKSQYCTKKEGNSRTAIENDKVGTGQKSGHSWNGYLI